MNLNYDVVLEYLEHYRTQTPPYDPKGVMHLLKAVLDNLQSHHTEEDLMQYAGCLSRENEAFIRKLLAHIPESRALGES